MTTIARTPKEAEAMGLAVYWPVKPCFRGHACKRWTASRACDECRKFQAEYDRTRRPEYAARKRELRRARRGKEYAARVKRRQKPENWVVDLLRQARHRAKRFGHEYAISEADICLVTVCPVLGIPLVPARGKPGPSSPTLDRVDNSRGYVAGNVRIISYRANALKRDASLAEVRGLLAYMSATTP